jgi:hypothetical protein
MTFETTKGKYVSKGVKEFQINVIDENGKCIQTVSVTGNKKAASNKIEKLKKEYKKVA